MQKDASPCNFSSKHKANLNTVGVNGGIIVDVKNWNKSKSMHSYGEIIVDLSTTTTLDLNVDLYVNLYGDIGTNLDQI